MRTLHIPELVITAEPKPSEVQYLEDRIDQFKSSATGITDGEWLGIFVRDNADFRWSRWWMTTRTVTKTCSCVSTLVRQPLQQDPHEWDASPIATVNLA